jgi:hypothetical protein
MFAAAIDIGTKNIRNEFASRIVCGRGLIAEL